MTQRRPWSAMAGCRACLLLLAAAIVGACCHPRTRRRRPRAAARGAGGAAAGSGADEPETPQPVPLAGGAGANTPPRSRPRRREPPRDRATETEPPKTDRPPVEPPKPDEEPPKTAGAAADDAAESRREVERGFALARPRDGGSESRRRRALNADGRTQYETAKSFIRQAEEALATKNLVVRAEPAEKAADARRSAGAHARTPVAAPGDRAGIRGSGWIFHGPDDPGKLQKCR